MSKSNTNTHQLDPLNPVETLNYVIGMGLFVASLPFVALIVGCGVLWDFIDRGFGYRRPAHGLVMSLAAWWNRVSSNWLQKLVRNPNDAFMVNSIIAYGVLVPLMMFYCAYRTLNYGFDWRLCFVYHVIRIGPYFMNFAYVFTLSHKEGHSRIGFFHPSVNWLFRHAFNCWIGLFYGVMSTFFSIGHSINHHMYNNGPNDVVSTSDKRRDSFRNYICYVTRWWAFHINLSSIIQFAKEGKYDISMKMAFGTTCFFVWIMFWANVVGPMFALGYLFYPLCESALLLSVINWVWHAFLNPDDPEDEYVGSITILNGPINVLGEDYHVVHHQYPGAHWSTHEKLYKKHRDLGDYETSQATMFQNTHAFELFFMIILRDYKALAERFIDLTGELDEDRVIEVLKLRLQAIWWGDRKPEYVKLQGKEIGNLDVGRPNTKVKNG